MTAYLDGYSGYSGVPEDAAAEILEKLMTHQQISSDEVAQIQNGGFIKRMDVNVITLSSHSSRMRSRRNWRMKLQSSLQQSICKDMKP